MIKITLHNPLKIITKQEVFTARNQDPNIKVVESDGQNIINYRIEEAKLDENQNIIETRKPPFYETTGRSLEWSIEAGQTLTFPEYVAKYLMNIYSFLEVVPETMKPTEELQPTEMKPFEADSAKSKEGFVSCGLCGTNFKNTRALALHMAHKHTETVINAR